MKSGDVMSKHDRPCTRGHEFQGVTLFLGKPGNLRIDAPRIPCRCGEKVMTATFEDAPREPVRMRA